MFEIPKQRVLIIYTGGTIGMVRDDESGMLVPFDFNRIDEKVPELKWLDFEVDTYSFNPLIDSSDMSVEVWIELVQLIELNYNRYIGFVVLHGTDTMAYTASALSFMLHNLTKPVVFTGSQLPLGLIRTDGKENLITALEIAGAHRNGKAMVPEVSVFFQSKLYRGNRTVKYNAENFNAFRSLNYPELAEAGVHIKYNESCIMKDETEGTFHVTTILDRNVAILKIFPGMTSEYVNAIFNIEKLRAVVMETFGTGNAPLAQWFIDIIRNAIKKEIIVLNVTQCLTGNVDMYRYKTGMHLAEAGVISGFDITTEAAIAKLMFLLGSYSSNTEIINMLGRSLKGEISVG